MAGRPERGNPGRRCSVQPMATQSTRDRIVAGAARMVEEKGLRAVSVQDVLGASGFSRRTFYQYFRSKDDVVAAVYQGACEKLLAEVRGGVDDSEGPVDRLVAGLDAYLRFQQEGGRLILELQAESVNPASQLYPFREAVLDRLVAFIDADIQRIFGISLDPRVYRSLYIGMEGLVIHERRGGLFTAEGRRKVLRTSKAMFIAVLSAAEHLPRADDADESDAAS